MIGCVIAMDSEAEVLLDQMEIKNVSNKYGKVIYLGSAFGKEVAVIVCGVGKVNAAVGACAVLACGADKILNFGVAGGLHANTQVGEAYLIEKVVQYDFDCVQINGGQIGTLDGETENFLPLFVPDGIKLPRRALGTGDRFNDSVKDHDLLIELGCDIREMECGAIAQVCKYANIPCVSVKAISDVYGMGSTTEQFKQNTLLACERLKACMKEILESL